MMRCNTSYLVSDPDRDGFPARFLIFTISRLLIFVVRHVWLSVGRINYYGYNTFGGD